MTHSTFVRRAVAGALVTAALSLPVHGVAAQKVDKDMQALAHYHLTEANLRSFYKAQENMMKAAMKDPSLQDSFDLSAGPNDNDDLATMAAKLEKVPAIKSALAGAGLTGMDFATLSMSYMQAAMAYGLMTQGPENMRIKKLPEGTPKENVDFVRTHQALIQQLDKELKSLMPPGSGDAGV